VPRLQPEAVRRRERTLLGALLVSLWGPFLTGAAVLLSQSVTQLADFVRRTVGSFAVALYVAWSSYRTLQDARTPRAERASEAR
jgi:hypothetical protein